MSRLLFFLLLLPAALLLWPAAHAQPTAPIDTLAPSRPTAPPAAQTATLRQARQLVLERRYDTAWRLLARLDPRNTDPAVAIEKTDLALRYYTATDQLTRFAFRDLKLFDLAPDSLRQLGLDSLRYRFAVRQVLERLQRRHPENYRLARALGDYYYTVQQCDCAEQRLGEDEVFLRTVTEYQEAHAHGQGDYLSYFALGYAHQRLGQFQASIIPFERSLELRPRNPTAHLNLAFVLLELRELEKARGHAHLAQQFFTDSRRKDDAGFLLKEIEARIRQTSGAATTEPTASPTPTDTATSPAATPPPTLPAAADQATEADKAAEPETDTEPEKANEQAPPVQQNPNPAKPVAAEPEPAAANPIAPKKAVTAVKSPKIRSGKKPNTERKASQPRKSSPGAKEANKP